MTKKYLALFFSAFWPGLGYLYLKKFALGISLSLIWFFLVSRFLQTWPLPVVMDSTKVQYYLIWGVMVFLWVVILADLYQTLKKDENLKTSFLPIIPFFILIPLYFYFCLPLKWRQPNAVIGSLHTHTTCSDGRGDYETIINLAQKLKYDFIAITDHAFANSIPCQVPPCPTSPCQTALTKCKTETRLLCFPGQEVTGKVHIIAVNIDHSIDPHQSIKKIVSDIHDQGGLAIAAHPYNPEGEGRIPVDELTTAGFDAMECERSNFTNNQQQYRISKDFHIPCLYSNDAHEIGMLKTVYSVCNQKIKTFADLKEAIKGNKCQRFSPLDYLIANFIDLL